MYKHAVRLMRCTVEAAIIRRAGSILKHSLELCVSVLTQRIENSFEQVQVLESKGLGRSTGCFEAAGGYRRKIVGHHDLIGILLIFHSIQVRFL